MPAFWGISRNLCRFEVIVPRSRPFCGGQRNRIRPTREHQTQKPQNH